MSLWLLVLCFFVAMAFWWSRKRVTAQSLPSANDISSRYRCVSIKPRGDACASAMSFGEQRFLTAAAPRLPLANCDARVCQCRYAHFNDRREEERRYSHAMKRGFNQAPDNREHRSGGDRRRSSGSQSHAAQ